MPQNTVVINTNDVAVDRAHDTDDDNDDDDDDGGFAAVSRAVQNATDSLLLRANETLYYQTAKNQDLGAVSARLTTTWIG